MKLAKMVSSLEALMDTRPPKNKSEVHSFLGTCASFVERLPNLANETKLLRDLIKTKEDFLWNDSHQKALESIKSSIIKDCLVHFNKNRPSELFVDAGPNGIGAVLTQIDSNGNNQTSHSFSDVENRFSQMEKEMLAMIWGLRHFGNELLANSDFKVL